MKWGVRHDKDHLSYRKFRKNRKQKEREFLKSNRSKQFDKEQEKLLKKIDNTKQYQNYKKYNKELEAIQKSYNKDFNNYVYGDMISTYGNERVSQLKKKDETINGAIFLTAITGVPIIAAASVIGTGLALDKLRNGR